MPSIERVNQILEMRGPVSDVIGHFPGKPTEEEAAEIWGCRHIDRAIAGHLFRNTMYSEDDCDAANAYLRKLGR